MINTVYSDAPSTKKRDGPQFSVVATVISDIVAVIASCNQEYVARIEAQDAITKG